MCNRARFDGDPETICTRFSAKWLAPPPHRWPIELAPLAKGLVVREQDGERVIDVMDWDVLGGLGNFPMTNVRQLGLSQWRGLAEKPENRCLVPLTEFCEWTPEKVDLGDGRKPIKGEMWFACIDQPIFGVAGFWQHTANGRGFKMVTCDPNDLVAEIHAVAMQQPYPADLMTMRGPMLPTRTA